MKGLANFGLVHVPDRKVGVVNRRFGRGAERDSARLAVKVDGSIGIQASVIQPNTRMWMNPLVNRVRYADQTYVPNGTIGLVNALAGQVRSAGRGLGRYIRGTDYFQDGELFLRNGGEQGRQLGYLPGGAYYSINPMLFEVITVDTPDLLARNGLFARDLYDVSIPEGVTGVVITSEGRPPGRGFDELGIVIEDHQSFQEPWIFLERGGQRGVQQETLDVGLYSINPWFAQVVHIPTRELTLEWSSRTHEKPDNFDASLEQIEVNIQGYRLRLDVSQTLAIPPDVAPRLVRRFGQGNASVTRRESHVPIVEGNLNSPGMGSASREPVQRFIGRVLGAAVSGYFTEVVGSYKIMEFIMNFGAVRAQLQDLVRNALMSWGVEAGETILEQFTTPDRELDELRRVLAGQDVELLRETRERARLSAVMENYQIHADMERIRIKLAGERDVEVLRRQVELLGPHQVVLERFVERMANINVPQVVTGGDAAEQLLSVMPLAQAQEVLRTLVQRYVPTEDSNEATLRIPIPESRR